MPEVSFSPRNQCTIDDPTDGAGLDSLETPTAPGTEPDLPLAFRGDWGAEGAGAGGSGSSLGSDDTGAGGASSGSSLLVDRMSKRDACAYERSRAVSTCGNAAYTALRTGWPSAVPALVSCVGALVSLDHCLNEADPSVR